MQKLQSEVYAILQYSSYPVLATQDKKFSEDKKYSYASEVTLLGNDSEKHFKSIKSN